MAQNVDPLSYSSDPTPYNLELESSNVSNVAIHLKFYRSNFYNIKSHWEK